MVLVGGKVNCKEKTENGLRSDGFEIPFITS